MEYNASKQISSYASDQGTFRGRADTEFMFTHTSFQEAMLGQALGKGEVKDSLETVLLMFQSSLMTHFLETPLPLEQVILKRSLRMCIQSLISLMPL